MSRQNSWNLYSDGQRKELEKYVQSYMHFLDKAKTERECVDAVVNMVEEKGFVELSKLIRDKKKLKAGDKVYATWMNKAMVLFQIGKEAMEKGMNILVSHIDSPRLDVKSNPLYEEEGIAYLDTHYYGGIKKYQWVTIPLAIHGVAVKKDGTTIEICIGEEEKDPVFFISDLLIHLSQEQLMQTADKVIRGEALDVIIGSMPYLAGEAAGPVKENILHILKEYYDMEEEDFLSAELEIVPAGRAREAGMDKSMVMAYGQDDKVCAYAALYALLQSKELARTGVVMLADKEEIGSAGATGMYSKFYENTIVEVMNLMGEYSELSFRRGMAASNLFSADVSSVYDPAFSECFEKKNVAYLGGGLVFNKYTGSRGKYDTNDANAEYLAKIRAFLEKEEVMFQFAEYGKVDLGGSGTVSHILAEYAMNVIDCGTAVMNMHAPYEVTSKADIYETMRGYQAFLKYAD